MPDDGPAGGPEGSATELPRRPEDILALSIRHAGPDVCVIVAAGDVDLATTPLLSATLQQQITTAQRLVALDLRAVDVFAPCGLTMLHELADLAARHGTILRLVCTAIPTLRAIAASRIGAVIAVHPDLDEALRLVP
jgi:anti-anti-sigma factor